MELEKYMRFCSVLLPDTFTGLDFLLVSIFSCLYYKGNIVEIDLKLFCRLFRRIRV